jgi:hypothetical protein
MSPEEMYQQAAVCEELALRTSYWHGRAHLLEAAQQWRLLASPLEALESTPVYRIIRRAAASEVSPRP